MNKLTVLGLCLVTVMASEAQPFNNNSQKSYINISVPKTPESSSFEKYGNIPVDEFSGTPNISLPIFSVKGKVLEVPLSLTYHASGIKVNQEASWVGLGFDLVAGGRVTVETKGNVDDLVKSYTSPQSFKDGLKRLFNKWHAAYIITPNASQLGYAHLDYGKVYGLTDPWYHTNDTAWDDNAVVSNAAWFGVAEPDIYHANFMGNSIDFYFDLLTDEVRFLGEKSLFGISSTRGSNNWLTGLTIVDNQGVTYIFNQPEKTKMSMPVNYGYNSYFETNSAWLLTQIIHPFQDTIKFTYANYGKTLPSFSWAASLSTKYPYNGSVPSPDGPMNQAEIDPYYISKIESSTMSAEFVMSTREDLRGPGARKLDRIDLKDRITNNLLSQYAFTYEYFSATAEPYENAQPDSIKAYYTKRLKLLTARNSMGSATNPHKFYYLPTTGPSKLSFAQDHWGYYNGVNNTTGYSTSNQSPINLVPRMDFLGNLASTSIGASTYLECVTPYGNPPGYSTGSATIHTSFTGFANSRECVPEKVTAYMMDSIIYPTGGSTKFEFEPHHSNYYDKGISNFVGGGVRIKKIKHYTGTALLESIHEYDYQNSGIYLGSIEYIRVTTKWPAGNMITLSSSGDLNADKQTVGYGSVKTIVKNAANTNTNGYIIREYNVDHPLKVEYTNVSRPFPEQGYIPNKDYLLKKWSNIPSAPVKQLDGKMKNEKFYDNTATLVKEVNYYYRQSDFGRGYYSVKAEDNYNGYQGVIGFNIPGIGINDMGDGYGFQPAFGWRRWALCLTPAISYFTVLDSVVTKTLAQGSSWIIDRKAFKYWKGHQPEFQITHNSDNTQSILYTRTPLSFIRPNIPSGGENYAYIIEQMKSAHMFDYPIEQVMIRRALNGDSTVVGAVFNVYDYARLKEVYRLETTAPLALSSDFKPTFYLYNYPTLPSFNVVSDSRYKLYEQAEYYSNNLLKNVIKPAESTALIWDDQYYNLIAQSFNTTSSHTAFSSFETTGKGNWNYSGTPVLDYSSPTGSKSYSLNTGAITSQTLDASKQYIVSFWYKFGTNVSVSGATITSSTGRTLGDWTYKEYLCLSPSIISITGTGSIDELRLYPRTSNMITFTYKQGIGIQTKCDINNRILYYEYDIYQRLATIRDQNRNIVQRFCYNYAGQAEDCSAPCLNAAPNWQNVLNSLRCQLNGSGQNTGYQEQEQKDLNLCSPSYNQSRWMLAGYNTTACPLPPPCGPSNCSGADKKCINGICETGVRINKSTSYFRGVWTCIYVYRWSDCSESQEYSEQSGSACTIGPACI